jgi:hypothetical protein
MLTLNKTLWCKVKSMIRSFYRYVLALNCHILAIIDSRADAFKS